MKAGQTPLAIVAGLLGVLMSLAIFWLPFLLASLVAAASVLPLLLVGLAYGPRSALVATATGMGVLAGYGFLNGPSLYGIDLASPESWACALALAYGLRDGLPAILLGWLVCSCSHRESGAAGRLPRRPPLPLIVNSLCATALLMVVALLLMLPGGEDFVSQIEAGLNAWQQSLGAEALDAPSLRLLSKSVFGIFGILWVLRILLLAALAYKILATAGPPPCPSPLYSAFEAPKGMCVAAVLTILLAFVTDGLPQIIAISVTLILALPLFLQGVAAAHGIARSLAYPKIWLTVFYGLLVLLMLYSGWAFPAVTVLGLVDQVARLRSRRSDASRQEEV